MTTLQNVLTYKFTKNGLYVRYCYKVGQVLLQNGKIFVLQNGSSGITKQSRITEWHNFYYKIGRGILQSGEIITKKRSIVQKDSENSVLEPKSMNVKSL